MKALTLWRPWAAAIVHGTKRVENREWTPPRSMLGQDMADEAVASRTGQFLIPEHARVGGRVTRRIEHDPEIGLQVAALHVLVGVGHLLGRDDDLAAIGCLARVQ